MPTTPKVLIVDDEEAICAALIKRLNVRKIAVAGVHSGEEALEEVQRNPYDVIILDIKLPGISGIDVLKRLKNGESSAEVIVLSGHASVDIAIEALQYGAYDYLLKPWDLNELLAKIISAYERRLEKAKFRSNP